MLDVQFQTVLRDLINPEKYMPSHFVKQKKRQAKNIHTDKSAKDSAGVRSFPQGRTRTVSEIQSAGVKSYPVKPVEVK